MLYRQMPMAAAVAMVNAALMTAILLGTEGDRRALVWFVAMLLVAALRLLAVRGWRRDPAARAHARRWGRIGTAGAFAAGLVLGGGAIWLWPQSETYQLFWVFLVGGMCAGAAGLHHAHLPTLLAFILPAALPFVARYALEGTERGFGAAAMILVFLAAVSISAWRSGCDFAANLRLRLDLARQAQELDAINGRLREEMARRRATEASLRQAQKMEAVGQLTGGIAHDFNNLLTAVLGSLAMLRKRLPADDARAARLVDNALQGAQRGAALTQRLLAFGRRQSLEPSAVELPALVRGMAELLRGALGGSVRSTHRFPPDLPPVYADANQLELAVLNLAANARDAMPGGGEIVIAGVERSVGPPARRAACQPALRGAQRHRCRRRHGRGDAGPGDGAFLHHQGGRQGHRARACPWCMGWRRSPAAVSCCAAPAASARWPSSGCRGPRRRRRKGGASRGATAAAGPARHAAAGG